MLDLRGLICPMPVLRLRKALRDSKPGEDISCLTDDPKALEQIPEFCDSTNHMLIEQETYKKDPKATLWRVRCGEGKTAA